MKEFLKKFGGFSLGPIIGALIGFITIPVTSHLVSAEQFGLANMFTVANNTITLIVLLGFDQAFVREYNETEKRKKLLFNSTLIPLIASVIIGIFLVIFQSNFAKLLFLYTKMSNYREFFFFSFKILLRFLFAVGNLTLFFIPPLQAMIFFR